MNDLARKALGGLAQFQLGVALLLFLPAGSLRFWQGWLYWSVCSASVLSITLYFLKRAPGLIQRRLQVGPGAEQQRDQKIIQTIAGVLSCALLLVAGFDWRFRGSHPPAALAWIAALFVMAGFWIVFRAYQENSYAAASIRVEANQPVIAAGPYRLIRHSMYAGAIVLFLATPLVLGSWWALPVALALCGVIVVRLLHEEAYLSANLPGYDAYRRQVRDRLLPRVW